MKITRIPNMEDFLNIIRTSAGKVFLHLPDHTACDLKNDPTASQLLRIMNPGSSGLQISFSDPRDTMKLTQYLITAPKHQNA